VMNLCYITHPPLLHSTPLLSLSHLTWPLISIFILTGSWIFDSNLMVLHLKFYSYISMKKHFPSVPLPSARYPIASHRNTLHCTTHHTTSNIVSCLQPTIINSCCCEQTSRDSIKIIEQRSTITHDMEHKLSLSLSLSAQATHTCSSRNNHHQYSHHQYSHHQYSHHQYSHRSTWPLLINLSFQHTTPV
jgi:hypothetical protein